MPFVFEMNYTYETKGAKRVAINQLGPSLSKRQCTAQVCFRPEPPPPPPASASQDVKKRYCKNLMEQPPPCLIFRGTGQKISQYERDAYPRELVVLWQPKVWCDRPIAVEWAKKAFKKMIDADIAAGVCDDSDRYLLFDDNLDSQKQAEYLNFLNIQCCTDNHKVVPGNTDETQPVDDGLGRALGIYMGEEEDAWLEDDENLSKWENNELTASDRRILIAQWYCKAYKKALEGRAKRKYFEHTGALLTADGSGDDLLKIEGLPKGETFTWDDDALPAVEEESPEAIEVEPTNVAPQRAVGVERDGDGDEDDDEEINMIDDEDEADEDDAPPAPREAPPGFKFAETPPSAEQLAFSKEEEAPGNVLVGKSILYNWPVVGWCVGQIVERNLNYRFYKTLDETREKVNFMVHYKINQDTIKTVLRLTEYGGEEEGSWILLEPLATGGREPGPSGALPGADA